MPKRPRKIRVGGRSWNAQKEKDAAAWQEAKAAEDADPTTRARKARERTEKEHERAKRQSWERAERARAHEERREEKEERYQDWQQKQSEQVRRPLMTFERLSHLRVLGLKAEHDDVATINKAYKTLALKYHPDRNGSASALAMMKLVNNAHDFLTK
jgi:hypothetical protein